jgi:hypothetical protein
MSFSYFDFSPAPGVFQPEERAEARQAGAQACGTPSENVWLDFHAADGGRRARLEEALRFIDKDDA